MGRPAPLLAALMLTMATPVVALAGMPGVDFTDAGRMRLSTLSFFVALFLLSSWAVKGIWNRIQQDVPRLPRLTFRVACGVVFLWGLLFVLVLTMISGARELMTPGAWEKNGATYKLKESPQVSPEDSRSKLTAERSSGIERLRLALLMHAAKHEGRFPSADDTDAIERELWELPRRAGMRYLYAPGATVTTPSSVVVYEPAVYDDRQLVLMADGRIERMSAERLQRALRGEEQP